MEICQRSFFQKAERVENWQEAIHLSATPLLQAGYITEDYIDAMIETVKTFGDYIVIFPGFAMPHAAPSEAIKQTGFAFLKLEEKVYFTENAESYATVILPIACQDSDKHNEMMGLIADVLGTKKRREAMFNLDDPEDVYKLFMDV